MADFSVYARDPKAAIMPWYSSDGENQTISQVIFYDGPTPPPGVFDNFTNIPSLSSDLKTSSYADMIPAVRGAGLR